jgi:hypothetical protein
MIEIHVRLCMGGLQQRILVLVQIRDGVLVQQSCGQFAVVAQCELGDKRIQLPGGCHFAGGKGPGSLSCFLFTRRSHHDAITVPQTQNIE